MALPGSIAEAKTPTLRLALFQKPRLQGQEVSQEGRGWADLPAARQGASLH